MTVAYIGGTFDLFHYGHVRLFQRAYDKFDEVVVSVNRDEFVARFKRAPIMNLQERMNMIASCRFVHRVIVNIGDEDSKPALLKSEATHFVHGSDWTGFNLMKQLGVTIDWLHEHKIELVYFPYTLTISTSEIIRRVNFRTKIVVAAAVK